MLSVLSVPSVPSVGSVGKFSNNKIGGVVSVLLLCLMTAKYVLQGTGRFVGIILLLSYKYNVQILYGKTVFEAPVKVR